MDPLPRTGHLRRLRRGVARPHRGDQRSAPIGLPLRAHHAHAAIAAQCIDSHIDVDIFAAQAVLREHQRDLGRQRRLPCFRRMKQHASKARRQRQLSQLAAFVGDAALAIDGAKFKQQRLCFVERRHGWSIHEGERRWVVYGPMGKVEHEAGKIGEENLGPIGRLERGRLRLIP